MNRFFAHFFLLVCAHTVFYPRCSAREDHLVVETSAGSVEGRLQSVIHGLSVKQFLGIPYAEPPVGELRFAAPQPAKPWQEVREAKKFGFACPQISMKEMFAALNSTAPYEDEPQSEDCLTLNVYTPTHANPSSMLAVMVWVHGGGFILGSGSTYNPSLIVAYHDVIIVSINYRLGVLGFFNILNTDVKGNYGMLDQVLVLKWVQQNIANFGGDPNNVTIFGESAGGMSVSHHLISPLSNGLFQRVIAQSGSSTSPYSGIKVTSTELVKILAKVLECDFDEGLMDCLRSKSWSDVLNAQRNVTYPAIMVDQVLSTVIIDGEFLPDYPRTLFSQGKINRAEVMMGMTANEGALMLMMGLGKYKDGADLIDLENMIRYVTKMHPDQNKLMEDAVLFEYTDQSDLGNRTKHRQAIADLGSDSMFNAPAVYEAKALSKAEIPVYFYVFDHYPHFSTFPKWLGAAHGVDLCFTIGYAVHSDGFGDFFKMFVTKFSDLEVGLSLYTMKLWTTFAKHGDPNVGETVSIVSWPRYNSSQHVHLRISLEPKIEYSFRERKMKFWNEFIPKLVGSNEKQESDKKAEETKTAKEEL